MFIVEMNSQEYGSDEFRYETKEEMQAGLLRLVDSALKYSATDNAVRTFYISEE